MNKTIFFLISFFLCTSILAQEVWISPSLDHNVKNKNVVIWFKNQFLPEANSYEEYQKKYEEKSREVIRKYTINVLKQLNNASFGAIKSQLEYLEEHKIIKNIQRHWIINGFSCQLLTEESLKDLAALPGVDKIFHKKNVSQFKDQSKPIRNSIVYDFEMIDPNNYNVGWNIEMIYANEVWKKFKITGAGVLNVVQDFGFKMDDPTLITNVYQNTKEIPNNGIDDDKNGYIDDYNGYNFKNHNSDISYSKPINTKIIHGNVVTEIICGRTIKNTILGVAPNSKWAGIIAPLSEMENSIEWAIEQSAHTYNMSFSVPNLGEYRTHLRKLMEHGAYCGLFFISGAGNFAKKSTKNYAPVPIQMRFPEDIPNAVFGVSGVSHTLDRPEFSSQGPVVWNTAYYNDGKVNKPDFCTFNARIPYVNAVNNSIEIDGNGNSFAAPHLAGVIALMLSANSKLTVWQVKELLIKASIDILAEGFDYQSGYGLVNALNAVKLAIEKQ